MQVLARRVPGSKKYLFPRDDFNKQNCAKPLLFYGISKKVKSKTKNYKGKQYLFLCLNKSWEYASENNSFLSHIEIVEDVTKEILHRNLIQTR